MASTTAKSLVSDRYGDVRRPGTVIGTQSQDGTVRKGVDKERVIAIDNGALRIQPLIQPGWGRSGLAYGPFPRQNGLAFAVHLLNGHNTSQSGKFPDRLVHRIWRWMRGSGANPVPDRMVRLLCSFHLKTMVRRFHWWLHTYANADRAQPVQDNLAVGWFPSEVPVDPRQEGNAFIVHAGGPVNGILRLRTASTLASTILSLQNVPIYLVVILRERGAAYYAASLPRANGMADYPNMRPLGIDPCHDDPNLYAAIYQSVSGEIGFGVDTRIYSACVEQLPALATWYGTAHAADRLTGHGPLAGSTAETGGVWQGVSGGFERTEHGVKPTGVESLALLTPNSPSGLIHTLVGTPGRMDSEVGIVWRYADHSNNWQFHCSSLGSRLVIREQGEWVEVAQGTEWRLQANTANSLQVLDDGETFGLYLNGALVFDRMFSDSRLQAATGVGLHASQAQSALYVQNFETHPRSVPMPDTLQQGVPWLKLGEQVVVRDEFAGPAGDLAGTTTTSGAKVWRKELGPGQFELTGAGAARVQATAQAPCPGRTAYTVGWDNPAFADVQLTITPPGTARHQGEKGRGGLVFWQDADNYITVSSYLDDIFPGSTTSSFFHVNGYEELYDAVWTNMGQRIRWGVPYTMRIAFDGLRYLVFINKEPVLYRSLRDVYPHLQPLRITRVGIVANWEWGTDTGSLFQHFVARV